MKLGIMQPYFFPYIGYFQLIQAVDKFIIADYLQYIKKGWINRNRVGILNQADYYITVPIQKFSYHTPITEIYIDNSQKWQQKIISLIQHNYKKSPYFNEIFPSLEIILKEKYEKISDLNLSSIHYIVSLLDINTEIVDNRDKYLALEKKESNSLDRKRNRIITLCKVENAHTYINAINGMALYHKTDFYKNDIELLFLKTNNIEYKQLTKDFIPHLSILDVLLNCGITQTKILLDPFELI